MAKDESTTTTKAAPAKATPKAAEPSKAAEKDEVPRVSTCVVNGGRGMHVGNAVHGKVCSYHDMHYDAAGNPR